MKIDLKKLEDIEYGGIIKYSANDECILLHANQKFYNIIGYTEEEFKNHFDNKLNKIICVDDLSKFIAKKEENFDDKPFEKEYRIICKSNDIKWINELNFNIKQNNELFNYSIITEKTSQDYIEGIKDNESVKLIDTISNEQDVGFEWDFENKIAINSDKLAQLFGCEKTIYNFPISLINLDIIHKDDIENFIQTFLRYYKNANLVSVECRVKNNENVYLWYRCIGKGIFDKNKKLLKVMGFLQNINDEKLKLENIYQQSIYDPLTQIYNKNTTKQKVDEYLQTKSEKAAMLIIDIDNFKRINDTYGHSFGDKILSDFANNLKNNFRKTDIIGRIGGDEFLIFLPGIQSQEYAQIRAQIILNMVDSPFSNETEIISSSIGISLFPQHGLNFGNLFNKADTALYYSKNHGKNNFCIYNDNLDKIWDMLPIQMIENNTKSLIEQNFNKNMVGYIINMLKSASNVKECIIDIIALIGKTLKLDRVSVFERSINFTSIQNTFEWCSDEKFSKLKFEAEKFEQNFLCYLNTDANGVYLYNENDNYNATLKDEICINKWIKERNVKSLLVCEVNNNQRAKGAITFEKCTETLDFTLFKDVLNNLTQIIFIYSKYMQQKQELCDIVKVSEQLYTHTNVFAYVIDENYEISYINNINIINNANAKSLIGTKCHKTIRNNDDICDDCPIKMLKSYEDIISNGLYIQPQKQWLEVTASYVKLQKNKKNYLISITNNEENNKYEEKDKDKIYKIYFEFLTAFFYEMDAKKSVKYCANNVKCTNAQGEIIVNNKLELETMFATQMLNNTSIYKYDINRIYINSNVKNKNILFAIVKIRTHNADKKNVSYELKHQMEFEYNHSKYEISKINAIVNIVNTNTNIQIIPSKIPIFDSKVSEIEMCKNSIKQNVFSAYLQENLPIYHINDCMLNTLGYENEAEFIRENKNSFINAVYNTDKYNLLPNIKEQLSIKNEFNVKFRIPIKDEGPMWVNCIGNRFVTADNKSVIVGICNDVSKQKELEKQLSLYENASRGGTFIVAIDEYYTLLYANDIFYHMHRYTKTRMEKELNNQYLNLICQSYREKMRKVINDAVNLGRTNVEWQIKIIDGDNQQKDILINAAIQIREGIKTMCGFVIDVTEQQALKDEISQNEERYRIALAQTKISIWEYEIATKRISNKHGALEKHGFNYDLENVPEFLILTEYVHPDSVEDIRDMYRKVDNGEFTVKGEFRFRNNFDNGWWWEKITYTCLYDENGNPQRAIALGEDITQQKNAEIQYQEDLYAKNILSKDMIYSSKCNLSIDKVELLNIDKSIENQIGELKTYKEIFNILESTIANEDDKKRYRRQFSSTALLKSFDEGKEYITMEYRKNHTDGKLRWVCLSVQLIKDAINANTIAYFVMKDIQEQKTLELSLRTRAEKDSLTGVYNKDTSMTMMQETLEKQYFQNKKTAVMVINIDNYSNIVKELGYHESDDLIKEIADIIINKLGTKHIIGRFLNNEFVCLIQENLSEQLIKKMADDIRKTINSPYMAKNKDYPVSASIGIVFSTNKKDKFRTMYEKARVAVELAKSNGKNRIVIYSNKQLTGNIEKSTDSTILRQKMDYDTSTQVNELLLKCACIISDGEDLNYSLTNILKHLCTYYDSDAAMILEYDFQSSKFKRIYGWNIDSGEYETTYNSKEYDDLNQYWSKYSEEHTSYVSDNIENIKDIFPEEYKILLNDNVKSFSITSCTIKHKPIAYIIVKNIKQNIKNQFLVENINSFIASRCLSEQAQDRENYLATHDTLTGLLNRNSYRNYRSELLEESVISIGIVYADINGLKNINNKNGQAYGDSIVKKTASLLKDFFEVDNVFRLSGNEFAVISHNISKDSFENIIDRLREKTWKDMYGLVSIGSTWSDTDIQIDKLLDNANEIMMIDKQNYYQNNNARSKLHDPDMLEILKLSIASGDFVVYLQPKARITSRKVEGAEALIRYHGKDTGIVYPDRFIPQLEQDGTIKYIDLFVFEEVCKIISKWLKLGKKPVTISLNFSRSTLLDQNIIETVEKIYNKYNVPKKYLEIEVTESMSSMERETLCSISGKIIASGYRLSLDDFGTKYSNISIISAINFSVIKLDKSLVNDIFSNEKSKLVIKNFLLMCKSLKIECVAEGVETIEQLEILHELECDFAQGYYFNKPIPVDTFEKLYIL